MAAESITPSPARQTLPSTLIRRRCPLPAHIPPCAGSLGPFCRRNHTLCLEMCHFFFFSLCYTAVLTKIRTCRVMPLVSGSSEENAAMPVSSQQGERLLEKGQETHSLQEQQPQRPPTSSPLPTTTDPPAFTCRRTAGQLLQL